MAELMDAAMDSPEDCLQNLISIIDALTGLLTEEQVCAFCDHPVVTSILETGKAPD